MPEHVGEHNLGISDNTKKACQKVDFETLNRVRFKLVVWLVIWFSCTPC